MALSRLVAVDLFARMRGDVEGAAAWLALNPAALTEEEARAVGEEVAMAK